LLENSAELSRAWQRTQYSDLIRYVPSGTFFALLRIGGNLIRKSHKTDLLTVAKLRLADLKKNERRYVAPISGSKGRRMWGDCLGGRTGKTTCTSEEPGR